MDAKNYIFSFVAQSHTNKPESFKLNDDDKTYFVRAPKHKFLPQQTNQGIFLRFIYTKTSFASMFISID